MLAGELRAFDLLGGESGGELSTARIFPQRDARLNVLGTGNNLSTKFVNGIPIMVSGIFFFF